MCIEEPDQDSGRGNSSDETVSLSNLSLDPDMIDDNDEPDLALLGGHAPVSPTPSFVEAETAAMQQMYSKSY